MKIPFFASTALLFLLLPAPAQIHVDAPPCPRREISFTVLGEVSLQKASDEESWLTVKTNTDEQRGLLYAYPLMATKFFIDEIPADFRELQNLPSGVVNVHIQASIQNGCNGPDLTKYAEVHIRTYNFAQNEPGWSDSLDWSSILPTALLIFLFICLTFRWRRR